MCARLPCGQCVQFFKTKKKLRRHVLLFHNPNACRCLECGKLFSEERSLEQHMGVHSKRHPAFKNSGSVTFHCGGCAEPSCSGVQLCRREREVHDPNVHRCLKCSQVFSKQPDLIEHMRIHIKQRPYACVCPVDFQTMNGLRKHALKCSRKSKRSKKGSGGLLWAVWPEIPEDRVPRQTHPGIVVSLAAAGVTS